MSTTCPSLALPLQAVLLPRPCWGHQTSFVSWIVNSGFFFFLVLFLECDLVK